MKNNELKAFNDDDIVKLLKSLQVYDDVISGNKNCIYCNEKMSLINIDAILPIDHRVEFSCSDSECHNKLLVRVGG
ncbi:MAG: hypothetical protein K0R46_1841 [Herbinix sp.]|jgi:hypothetical protein|nr:hypothetical protein [Herbinix sp.]